MGRKHEDAIPDISNCRPVGDDEAQRIDRAIRKLQTERALSELEAIDRMIEAIREIAVCNSREHFIAHDGVEMAENYLRSTGGRDKWIRGQAIMHELSMTIDSLIRPKTGQVVDCICQNFGSGHICDERPEACEILIQIRKAKQ